MRARPGDRAVHPHTAAEQLIKDRLAGSAGPERRRGGALPAFLFIVLLVVLLVPGAAGSGLCREGDLDGLLLDIAASASDVGGTMTPARRVS